MKQQTATKTKQKIVFQQKKNNTAKKFDYEAVEEIDETLAEEKGWITIFNADRDTNGEGLDIDEIIRVANTLELEE